MLDVKSSAGSGCAPARQAAVLSQREVPPAENPPDRPIEIWRMFCDSTKARERLGWSPQHSPRQGLAKTIAWYEAELSRPDSSFWVAGTAPRAKLAIV